MRISLPIVTSQWIELHLQNWVTDISSLAGIERVGQLNLSYNEIEDITPLSGLTDLGWLGLRANNLVVLGGTFDSWNGTYIDLNENPLICSEVDAAR